MALFIQYQLRPPLTLSTWGGGTISVGPDRSLDVKAALTAGSGTIAADATDARLIYALDVYPPVQRTGTTGTGSPIPLTSLLAATLTSPADGEVIVFNAATGRWQNAAGGTGGGGGLTAPVQETSLSAALQAKIDNAVQPPVAITSLDSATQTLINGAAQAPVSESDLAPTLAAKINTGLPATRVALGSAAAPVNSGTAQTITLTSGDEGTNVDAYLTLTANCTITVAGIGTLTSCVIRIIVTQDGTGGRTLAIKVGTGGTPNTIDTLATTANAKSSVYAYTDDGANLVVLEPPTAGGGGGTGTPDGRLIVDASVGDGAQNARPAIQAQLDAAKTAGNGHVYVPAGTYLLAGGVTTGENLGGLLIASNTKLELHPGATIKRANNSDGMLRPDSGGNGLLTDTGPGGYTGTSNIEIFGGTWDGNQANFPTAHNILTSVHGDRWTVRDVVLKNGFGFHALEFNSSRNCRALRVTFLDFDPTTAAKEFLQIDDAGSPLRGGLADSTPCQDVLVQACHFRNGARGIGTHSTASPVHRGIRVVNNYFDTLREEAILGWDWFDSQIEANTITNAGIGIKVTSSTQVIRRVTINANTIVAMNATGTSNPNYGIWLEGVDNTNRRCREITVNNNTVDGTSSRAASWGINVRCCQDISLAGNRVANWNQSGLAIWRTTKAAVAGNSCSGNNTSVTANHGDILAAADGATTMQDVVLSGNNCGTVVVGPLGDRVAAVGNIITSTLTTPTTLTTNFNKVANFINGTWTA